MSNFSGLVVINKKIKIIIFWEKHKKIIKLVNILIIYI